MQKNCKNCKNYIPGQPFCKINEIANNYWIAHSESMSEPSDSWKTDATVCGYFEEKQCF